MDNAMVSLRSVAVAGNARRVLDASDSDLVEPSVNAIINRRAMAFNQSAE
jgi:hypothetical protein